MTPDLLAEFAAAMSDLQDVADALDQHGPAYLRRCMEADELGYRGSPTRPPELPGPVARVIRELADDALVRAAARRPLPGLGRSAR